jgi:hybrid cluster-associated redox disulfide protein
MRSDSKQPNPNSTIAELLETHPVAAQVLLRHGMACVGCTMAAFETLAEAAREYRVNVSRLLMELRAMSCGSQQRERSDARASRAGGKSKPQGRETDS